MHCFQVFVLEKLFDYIIIVHLIKVKQQPRGERLKIVNGERVKQHQIIDLFLIGVLDPALNNCFIDKQILDPDVKLFQTQQILLSFISISNDVEN